MTQRLRLFFAAAGLFAVAFASGPAPQAAAEVAADPPDPLVPQRRLAAPTPEAIRAYVEEVAADRYGAAAVAEARAAPSSIIAVAVPGRFNAGGPRVAIALRSAAGWTGRSGDHAEPLPAAAGAEIDRLLASAAFRAEPDRYPEMDCPDSGASLMVVRHRGALRTTRQSCMPANLVGRLFRTVLDGRAQPAG